MGRKIPGKKHLGTKDPAQQRRVRHESVKHKINSPPEDIDEQPVPSNLQKIAQWKNLDKNKLSKSQLKKGDIFKTWLLGKPEDQPGRNQRIKEASPTCNKLPRATDKKSLNNVVDVNEEMVNEYRRSHDGSSKPKPEIVKKKGDVNQIIMNAGGKLRKKKSESGEEQVSKKERMKLRLAAKKQARMEKMQERQDEKDNFVDIVEFGEVVHAPPTLSLPTKNKVKDNGAKPGQRVLLLKQFLPTKHKSNSLKLKKSKEERKADIRSVEERNRLDRRRLQTVQEYRKLKAMKRSNH